MKTAVVLLFVFCYVQCRKTYPPIDKNANLAFINMEGGAGVRPGSQPQPQGPPAKPASPVNHPSPGTPLPTPKPVVIPTPAIPKPVIQPTPVTPKAPTSAPPSPKVNPQTPHQIKPVPVNPTPVVNPISTPGPGTVKQLVNFYDSQGKASPIRPYSYSQAVKQG